MINAATIAQMKDGVRIVNVARGKLVDEASRSPRRYRAAR
jgi:lactate dehydrogenase-like 2-hydroxyacid dehydrogenase